MPASKFTQISRMGLLGLAFMVGTVTAFVPKSRGRFENHLGWELNEVIKGDIFDTEAPFDAGAGGVRLAQESAIKVIGSVKHKPGKAEAKPSSLLRYKDLQVVDGAKVKQVLDNVGSAVLASGQGVELYKDPGQTTEKVILYAPVEAAKDAFSAAASAIESEELVFNFLGGDDLIMQEVMDAASELVINMDIATKAKISYNSLCHKSIPLGTCTVTVVSVGSGETGDFKGVDKSIASGEVYLRDGAYYTVDEADIDTALE